MLFWTFAILIAAIVMVLLVGALLRTKTVTNSAQMDIYRDQLAEVDRDLARGTLAQAEADRVRVEISRRLLDADRVAQSADKGSAPPRMVSRVALCCILVLVVGGGGGLYYNLGAPQYPDMPLKLRVATANEMRATRPSQALVEASVPQASSQNADPAYLELVEELRAVLKERPDDVQGLTFLARNEAALGNWGAAYQAQQHLIDVKANTATAEDYSVLAHFTVLAAGGYVSPEAEMALKEALARDPTDPPARYYIGLMFTQVGRPDVAFRYWSQLLAESPPDSPWIPPIRAQIEEIAYLAGEHNYVLPPEPELRGPTAADIEAAEDMNPAARQEMVRNMVAGLADRLATEGGPASEWARLIRAYGVLGEVETARPIWEEARAVFEGRENDLAVLEAAARDAGLLQ